MQVADSRMTASVGSMMLGSGRSSMRTSRGPWRTAPRMIRFLFLRRVAGYLHRVSGLLVERRRLLDDVRAIHLLAPFGSRDFLEGDRYRLVAVVQDRCDVFGNRLGELAFLPLGLSGPEFDDDMGHGSVLISPDDQRGTDRRLPVPTIRRSGHRAAPAPRCVSAPLWATHHASASRLAETRRHHRVGSPR